MVGIVIVSHSEKVAEGAKELALQMAKEAPVAAAGGMADGSIGTDVEKIVKAIKSVQSEDGVVVLVDLGSAIMSSEMAIEITGGNVKIVDGPIVEGAIVAAVESVIGSNLETVTNAIIEAKTTNKLL
ncbi:MAG: phosphoenolpyruvate---glycerone phosphotransferase subunit DhaM [Epulopiscium sp.]|jgi:dihydroxyacetone kinase phosphotransfer subunit|uniref:phosphoenolpyruvate--glycerone phosphotransferase n=1 Tax=Defluviitalea raffinosedens TaxID=1450156 RepID=A0A7C8HFX5_9FIRM|nr:dihydroxyacetone kinase phosphoryl donor subunit DhaM [Defluviitalea raffinosedens]MBZ4667336.1 PTS-dependent dihydroxyacetone kinase phosphotransferase subunit DhaM [Defluviitaleaceae bacterium]MDK2787632.1 phosphoenolpyruvate---glycerone phosphotransferase subunit DhaM [Candidatus Epulonipiscium sp.]KAE9632908.1 PTS-dependent dihydroxyacetone kinase phosphotransferase subunit DhaM [Defluviitalea raffinosedens]MBM7684601.1 dihydroxyacetone kinase phosphotransfer subunit [Defluviitalea raffi